MTKTDVLKAIKLLTEKYQKKIAATGQGKCPLCLIFYRDNGTDVQSTKECSICPNVSFAKRNDCVGCYTRSATFNRLNCHWNAPSDFKSLVSFWKEIELLYTETSEEDILSLPKELRMKIRTIAKKYK